MKGALVSALLAGVLGGIGCLSAGQITAELRHLDELSRDAQTGYLRCLSVAGLTPEKVPTDAAAPPACLPDRRCLASTTAASAAGAQAVASGKFDPWLRGPAAQRYRGLYPAAVLVCRSPAGAP